MPLTDLQRMVIRVLRPFRTRHDYVGGGAALNQDWPRLSDDMDIFHDDRNRLPRSVERELSALRDDDFAIETVVSDNSTVEVIVRKYGFETRVQWMDDPESCKRFSPSSRTQALGFACTKPMLRSTRCFVLRAATGRRAMRSTLSISLGVILHWAHYSGQQ